MPILKAQIEASEVAVKQLPNKKFKFASTFAARGAWIGFGITVVIVIVLGLNSNSGESPGVVGYICFTSVLAFFPVIIGALWGHSIGERKWENHKELWGLLELGDQHSCLVDYEKKLREWSETQERMVRSFWTNLDGHAFEREIATLYRRQGFDVEETGASGDGGVDLILWRDETFLIAQCKQHSGPIAPAVVRDLYGAMISEGADGAILVATSGFTTGTQQFAAGKPIELVDLNGILKMASGS